MKKLILSLIILGVSVGNAANLEISRRDAKFPTQQMVEKQSYTNPIAAGTTDVLSAHAGPTSAALTTVSSGFTAIITPRNLVITPVGTTGDVENCALSVTGTNIFGASITEVFQFIANQSTAVIGRDAFASVTSLSFPANCESGGFAATWSIGVGERLGVKRCMTNAGDIFFSNLNGAKEATAPTVLASTTRVSSNTADFNGTMNGANDFDLYFMQSYTCFP